MTSEEVAQCKTVGELREALEDFDSDRPVTMDHEGVVLESVHVRDLGDKMVFY